MKRRILSASAVMLLAGAAVAAALPEREPPQLVDTSQYSAVLDQAGQQWRLLGADGDDLAVSALGSRCLPGRRVPQGLWLVTRDGQGQPVLRAPSVTPLPRGYPELVPLLACGSPSGGRPHVAAPRELIDWLGQNSGAILVQN